MARVTTEDCLDKISSSFELVLLAAKRARQINGGDAILTEVDEFEPEKSTVIALKEISEDKLDLDALLQDSDYPPYIN